MGSNIIKIKGLLIRIDNYDRLHVEYISEKDKNKMIDFLKQYGGNLPIFSTSMQSDELNKSRYYKLKNHSGVIVKLPKSYKCLDFQQCDVLTSEIINTQRPKLKYVTINDLIGKEVSMYVVFKKYNFQSKLCQGEWIRGLSFQLKSIKALK